MTQAASDRGPVADKKPVRTTWHGVELVDDYAWLRDDNWQQVMRDPSVLRDDIRQHLEAENAHTTAWLADTEALQATLFQEMKGRIKEDDSSVPSPDGNWLYFSRFETGQQYPILCRRPRDVGADAAPSTAADRVMLDGNVEAEGQSYWRLGGAGHSPDHLRLAYAVDTQGSERFTLRFRDLETGRDLDDQIPDAQSFAWSADGASCLYVRLDDNHRPKWVFRHVIGTPVDDDTLVYEEADPGFFVSLSKLQSGDWIALDVHRHECSEIHLINAHDTAAPPRLIAPRREGHEYDVEHQGERLIILTNSGGAVDFRMCEAPLSDPREDNWREIEPHRPGRLILSHTAFNGHLARLERENGLPRIVITDTATGQSHDIAFAEEAYSLGMSAGYEFDTTGIRFTYASPTTPTETYDYDMASRKRTLRKRQEVPSGHDPANYVTRRIMAPARDGETVPVTLLHHAATPVDGSAPLSLYGYGSYGIAMPAGFSTTRLSLVDRGFIYAIAHVRGGKEKGYQWYLDGKREKKTNTFNDFVDAGRHLAELGLTQEGRIVAQGGSAGGMLMGAIANQAPELFLGIIADVPFVDVLNTMLDKDLPLTPPEWPEWGNPIENEADFHLIRAYSPYDQVAAKAYPHILALAGLSDPRVTYWEPAKWIARLRERSTSPHAVLLRTNMDAGHGGASGRFEALKEVAIEYAFALKIAGLADKQPAAS